LLDQHNELKKKAEGTRGCYTGDTTLILLLVSSQGVRKRQTTGRRGENSAKHFRNKRFVVNILAKVYIVGIGLLYLSKELEIQFICSLKHWSSRGYITRSAQFISKHVLDL